MCMCMCMRMRMRMCMCMCMCMRMCMCMCACPRVCASERRQKATLHASSILRKVREGPGGEEVLVLRWEGHDFELPRQP